MNSKEKFERLLKATKDLVEVTELLQQQNKAMEEQIMLLTNIVKKHITKELKTCIVCGAKLEYGQGVNINGDYFCKTCAETEL